MATPQNPTNPTGAVRSLMTELGKGAFWAVLIRGILAVLFGILLLAAPAAMAVALGIWVGAWFIVDGIFEIAHALQARKQNLSWGWELAGGIAYVIGGIVIMIVPLTFAIMGGTVILLMMASGMLIRGVLSVASKSFKGWSKALGVLDIIFGVIMFIVVFSNPGAALLALVWIIAIYTIIFGIFLIVMAFVGRSKTKKAQVS
ncbi:HdeD family acid-resistance protein [Brevibacterium linens]|uniref:Uncharacterized membrane protein HdeD, DUF308 family n=1 Tax=Brevibacterium linens ATCC 9172 TaxID=1255617 RepID=A0A2H1KSD5_BRELN|nr:DUF308 domain-containing protein [Brevibacterium linens]KAB1942007.1 hypothetical protein F8227_17480 [Brevibacterium linens ATCC 9172]SMY02627.1 Uncharacterized membrane protein HdeD, DUF308 family [Brevibacterium linens ATCC 9172]